MLLARVDAEPQGIAALAAHSSIWMYFQMGSLAGTASWRNNRTSAECRFKATWLPRAIAAIR